MRLLLAVLVAILPAAPVAAANLRAPSIVAPAPLAAQAGIPSLPSLPALPALGAIPAAPSFNAPQLALPSAAQPAAAAPNPASAPSALGVARAAGISPDPKASADAAKGEIGRPFDATAKAGVSADAASVPGSESSASPLAAPSDPSSSPKAVPPSPSGAPADRPYIFSHYRLARLVLRPLIRVFYKTRIAGLENLPSTPAVIVPNHISYVDALLITFAADRPMRFMMKRQIFNKAPRLMAALGAIPVSSKDGPAQIEASLEAARQALRAGQSVVIFPEGQLTQTGNMIGFRRGFERIVAGAPAPVIPAYLDGLWGSVFSMQKGPSFWSRLKGMPRPVSVRFGPALNEPTAQAARLAVTELGAASMGDRVATQRKPLAREFFAAAHKFWKRPAVADSLGQNLTYGKTLTGAILLGQVLDRQLDAQNTVAILMPPSASGALANLALASIGRVPVNLNYTAPKDAVAHAVATAQISTIVTSRKFLEALKADKGFTPPEGAKLVIMEDLAPLIPAWKKTALYLALKVLPKFLSEKIFLNKASRSLDDTATILFTSGSSALPKGVVLTQANVLADAEMVREILPWAERDVILGVLPFFHSFGYTVTLWLPLISGMGAAYHTHPMQAEAIGKLAEKTNPTILLGTPAFLQRYSQKINAAAFAKLRLVIAGAEKLRDTVADEFQAKFGVRPYEGYGATELSPVATAATPDAQTQKGSKPGSVGRALPGSAIKAVDMETGKPVPDGQSGMLMVKGPHVMKEYLGEPAKTAEVLKDGWYITGDMGTIDRDGFVTITGRLSRFSKLAGEMVSHVAVEEKLQQAAGLADMTFVVAGAKDPKRGEKLVVLYAGWDGDLDALLSKMRALGVPNLWLPGRSDFHKIDAIPLLGTGKLDLKAVNELVKTNGY
jgi:acyl-[acyl-carrier-protein]-phospholipid O-acyltransferase/long-chain-fatty-acid--[acyl-carrier-protein] ligase